MDADTLLTEVEAAQMLKLKPSTLNKWRATRRGPVFIRPRGSKKGRVHYRLADVQAFLMESRVDPTKPLPRGRTNRGTTGVRHNEGTHRGSR